EEALLGAAENKKLSPDARAYAGKGGQHARVGARVGAQLFVLGCTEQRLFNLRRVSSIPKAPDAIDRRVGFGTLRVVERIERPQQLGMKHSGYRLGLRPRACEEQGESEHGSEPRN